MSLTRDMLVLAAVAFREKRYSDAGTLFATAMSCDDSEEFFENLSKMDETSLSFSEKTLAQISKEISLSMEDPETDATEDEEDEEDEEEIESDDLDPDNPGELLLPSSISSKSSVVIKASKSPIGIK
jgi:hypothetical protein